LEAQPNTSAVSSILASFYNGANLLGQIPLDVDGSGGARLFAGSSTTPIDRIVISSSDDFAIAQVRGQAVPEPGLVSMLIGLAFGGSPLVLIRVRRLRSATSKARSTTR